MSLENIVVGDYGQILRVTIIDVDTGAAADISSYSSLLQMIFTKPDGTEVPKTATFQTSGTDGVIQYTVEDGLFNAAGWWKIRGRVQGASSKLTSVVIGFVVID